MDPPWSRAPALPDSENGPWPPIACCVRWRGPRTGARKSAFLYGTHASRLAAVGVPSVVFGPGSIAQAHTKDEWIAISELNEAAEIYYRFAAAG